MSPPELGTHEQINQTIRSLLLDADKEGVMDLSPTLLALRCFDHYKTGHEEIHIEYAALEHYKQMSRAILANKFGAEGQESEAIQDDMFSGLLQSRYPIKVKRGDQPIYRPLDLLTEADFQWNIAQLRRSAYARLKHADALQAYRDSHLIAA